MTTTTTKTTKTSAAKTSTSNKTSSQNVPIRLDFINDEAKTCQQIPVVSPSWDAVCSRLTEVAQTMSTKVSRPRIVVYLPTIGMKGVPNPSEDHMRSMFNFILKYKAIGGEAGLVLPNIGHS